MPSPKTVVSLIPDHLRFVDRVDDEWVERDPSYYFKDKRVLVVCIPGAFTPTCSQRHIPEYEKAYDTFKSYGIDEVYCLSVNDGCVMTEWFKSMKIKKMKMKRG